MKYYIGIDLGGTSVRVAKVDENGNVVTDIKRPSYGKESAEKISDNIISILSEYDLSDIEAIGIGVPGPVDTKRRVMTVASNMPYLKEFPLAARIEEATGKKVVIDNDANVAGLAEALLGAGKGKELVFYFTQSTGIGGALIANGRIISGRNGCAGEIGNIIIKDNGEKINHLNAGSAETEASGTALGRKAKAFGIENTYQLFEEARKGEPNALALIDDMSKDIARMMQAVSQVLDPDCYVIGGGIAMNYDMYFDKVAEHLNTMVHEVMKDVPIYHAELEEPGVVGAAMLAKTH